jgi:hypothetical protein
VFSGEAGLSAPLRETDYSHRKHRCDVLLNGSAYAPGGRAVDRVRVSLRAGSVSKSFYVFGHREWMPDVFTASPSAPQPFLQKPFSYATAYGGVEVDPDRPERVETLRENPVGVGYHPFRKHTALIGLPLPCTAEGSQPIDERKGRFRPMSFGPVARNFYPRYTLAGTYDEEWQSMRAPFWPEDFSYAYFQCAPEDQQTRYLEGGEEVVLENLTPDGLRVFCVPRHALPVTFLYYRAPDLTIGANCDTLLIEPDEDRFCLTWRISLPLRRNCFELNQVIIGERSHSWRSARRAELSGKTYYRNLAELVNAKRGDEGPVP